MNGRMRLHVLASIGFLSLGLASTARATTIDTDPAKFLANVQAGYYGNVTTGTVTVTLDNGATYSVIDASSTSFVGFTTNAPILSLTVNADANNWATVNDLIVGTASVPEPGSFILLGLGIAVRLTSSRLRAACR